MTTQARARRATLSLFLLAGCTADSEAFPEMRREGADLALGLPVVEIAAGSPADSLDIALPSLVAVDGDAFLVPDVRGDRVLRLDGTFHRLIEFGREGAGPGELSSPVLALPTAEGYVVGELQNGRFSVFDRQGRHIRTVPAGHAVHMFGVRADGRYVSVAELPTHYARLVTPDGTSAPFAARPPALRADSGTDMVTAYGTLLLVGPGDTTHVLDNERGVLLKYDPDGALRLARALPADVIATAIASHREIIEIFAAQGRRVLGAQLLKSMTFADDGSIIVVVGRDELIALRVEPADYTYSRIVAPMGDDWVFPRTTRGVAVRGERFYSFAMAGLSIHPIEAHRP